MPGFLLKKSMKFILGTKLGMTQIFNEKGEAIPVTLVSAGPCYVTQIKTKEKDGYEAIQIGFLETKRIKKPQQGHLKKIGKNLKYLKEFKGVIDISQYKVGDKISVSVFEKGEKVLVSGISKGKGFAGAVKRWGFRDRGPSHGVKKEMRTVGSVGCRFPQRVIKGKKMPGRMGSDRVTVKNLEIVDIDPENNLLAIKGALPGKKGTLLEIRTVK